jgi:hypothetical protein
MKTFVALIAVSLVLASAAVARDSRDMLRDQLAFCTQFVINEPDPVVVLNYMRECCAYSRNLHDCRMYEWEVLEGRTAR